MAAVKAWTDLSPLLTLILPALLQAANLYFLATGSNKAQALHHVLTGTTDPTDHPGSGVRLAHGTVIWWVDREVAALVERLGDLYEEQT